MPNTEPMTDSGFASKVEWEGGVIEALEYGLKPTDAPEGPIRDAWTRVYDLWQQFEPAMGQVNELLGAVPAEPEGDEED